MPEKHRRPQDRDPAAGEEAVYRGVVPASQTVNGVLLQFFFSGPEWRKSAVSVEFEATRG